jgi:hypothetical protein
MNKRMKDPKGDLRFVHKSTRIYDFSSLKLTAMACGRQAKYEVQRSYRTSIRVLIQIPTWYFVLSA